jgi:hypothetical protein
MHRRIVVAGQTSHDQYYRSPVLVEGRYHCCATFHIEWQGISSPARLTSFNGPTPRTKSVASHRLPQEIGEVDVLIFNYPLRPIASALWLKRLLRPTLCFWDYCDDFYYGRKTLPKALLTSLWQRMCDRVLVLSPTLVARFPNALHWDNASHLTPKQGVGGSERILGTIASLDERFDRALYERMVDALPEFQFHLHGRIYNYRNRNSDGVRRFQAWLDLLATRGNFKYFGPYSNQGLQAIVSSFDIGLIPYVPGPLCQHLNPDKYYHYTNAGVPVLAAPIPSLLERSNIVFYSGLDDVVKKVRKMVADLRNPSPSARFDWSDRLEELLDAVEAMSPS